MASYVFADSINIAVAGNFSKPISEITKAFKQQTGTDINISTGSTGTLYNQILNGAPFSIFLAADESSIQKLIEKRYAISNTKFTYATGQLILWSPESNFVDPNGKILYSNKFKHIAIANPKIAPYGMAAMTVINALHLEGRLQDKLVDGENINSTYEIVASGNAEIGFLALSNVYYGGKIVSGSWWLVPSSLYAPIKQDAVITSYGAKNQLAFQFMGFLKSSEAKNIISSYGYK